jgi:hypothetical protein
MSVREQVVELQVVGINDLLRAAEAMGFRKSFPLPFEKIRLVNENGDTLTIQFDAIVRVYGDNALEVAGHLLRSGAAT